MHIWGNAEEEFPTMITKINMPFLFARRAFVNTYYPKYEKKTGAFVTVNSSIMNEQIVEEAQKEKADATTRPLLTNEVIAFNYLNYIRLDPLNRGKGSSKDKRGVKWTSVYCVDIAGMVPDKFVSKLHES